MFQKKWVINRHLNNNSSEEQVFGSCLRIAKVFLTYFIPAKKIKLMLTTFTMKCFLQKHFPYEMYLYFPGFSLIVHLPAFFTEDMSHVWYEILE